MVVAEERDVYLSDFMRLEHALGAGLRAGLHRLRTDAMSRFAERGFPTQKDEEWRFTNLAPLTKVPFQRAERTQAPRDVGELLATIERHDAASLVFVNGYHVPELSALTGLPDGVVL